MGSLIYLLNVSLDGFVETTDRGLDWTSVDEELHGWFNEQMRSLDATLYGRRMYELMSAYWPTAGSDPATTPVELEFAAIWRSLPKVVFSTTLDRVDWNSRLVAGDVGDRLAEIRREYDGDLGVAGATLAGSFSERGLVDEYRLVVHPVILGSGTPYFPSTQARRPLRLLESRSFACGAIYLRYTTAGV